MSHFYSILLNYTQSNSILLNLTQLYSILGITGSQIDLEAAEANWWETAWEKQLQEQNLFNNMAGDALKAVLRIWGWLTLDVLLYHI